MRKHRAPQATGFRRKGIPHSAGGTFKYVPTLRRFLGSREYQGLRRRFIGNSHYGTASSRAEGSVSARMRESLAGTTVFWAQRPCG